MPMLLDCVTEMNRKHGLEDVFYVKGTQTQKF